VCEVLDVRRLGVLQAVVETGSITEAARALGYTPSAVSQAIAALEKETHISLFEKAGRGIRPTQAGLLLCEHARAIAARIEQAETALEAMRAGRAGRLRLSAFATAGASLVPEALARFKVLHPGVGVELRIAEAEEALTELRAGSGSVAVVAEEGHQETEHDSSLVYRRLLDDPYRIILPRSHWLATRGSVALEDLAEEGWVATASARCYCLPTVTTACARAGFSPRFVFEADEFATTVGFVAAGLGIALVPHLALGSIPDDVRVCRVRGREPARIVYAVTRAAIAGEVVVGAMMNALEEAAKKAGVVAA
jgi:DNA-binding transcriptional LysR family regulator